MAFSQPVMGPQLDATFVAPAREKVLTVDDLRQNAIYFELGLNGQIVGVIFRFTEEGLLQCSFDNGYSFNNISNGYEEVPGKLGAYSLVCMVEGSQITCSLVMN